MYFSKVVVY